VPKKTPKKKQQFRPVIPDVTFVRRRKEPVRQPDVLRQGVPFRTRGTVLGAERNETLAALAGLPSPSDLPSEEQARNPKRLRNLGAMVALGVMGSIELPGGKNIIKVGDKLVDLGHVARAEANLPAAVKVNGQIFSGRNHALATARAKNELGAAYSMRNQVDGFTLPDGTFIDRDEARVLRGKGTSEEMTGEMSAAARRAKMNANETSAFRNPETGEIKRGISHLSLIEQNPKIDFSTWEHGYTDDAGKNFTEKLVARAGAKAKGEVPPDAAAFIARKEAEHTTEEIAGPAIKLPNGKILEEGKSHQMIALNAGFEGGNAPAGSVDGWVTENGRFVTREETDYLDSSDFSSRRPPSVPAPQTTDMLTKWELAQERFHQTGRAADKQAAESAWQDYLTFKRQGGAAGDDVASRLVTAPGNDDVRKQAQSYLRGRNLGPRVTVNKADKVDEGFAARVADTYEKAVSNPKDPEVIQAYRAFARETKAQYKHLQKQGIKFEFVTEDPYKNSAEMMADVRDNKRLKVFKTSSGAHPLLSEEENDMFRAVHDYFGHAKEGNQFGPKGEENAFREHASMFSPNARRAMATETRGQNSWVNYGPFGKANRANPAQTKFAEQKVFLMPDELVNTGVINDVGVAAETRAYLDDKVPQRTAARRERFMQNLLPHERARFEKMHTNAQDETLRIFSLMPTPEEGAHLAALGARQHGWYKASAKMLDEAFGEDAPRFTALLAATSPRQSVEKNLLESMEIWRDWQKAGKPNDPAAINKLLDARGVMQNRRPNALTALSTPVDLLLDPKILREGGLLSGPKVDPFFANTMGEMQRVTNDTWQAQIAGANKAPQLVTGNLAMTAGTRAAIPEFERLFGTRVDPANIQEMQWSAGKAAGEAAGRGGVAEHFAGSPDLFGNSPLSEIDESIRNTPSFASLLSQPKYRDLLQQIGGKVPTEVLPEGLNIDPSLIDPLKVRSIFERMDKAQAGRYILPAATGLMAAPWMRQQQ
jgi:hypothetical protein